MRTLAAVFLASSLLLTADDGHQHTGKPPEKLGRVNFVTSCSAKAQSGFERGLALLHSFWFEQAEKSFHDAAQADPHCGIAWWGMAASHYHPLWEPPTPAELAAGSAFIAEAGKLSAPAPCLTQWHALISTHPTSARRPCFTHSRFSPFRRPPIRRTRSIAAP